MVELLQPLLQGIDNQLYYVYQNLHTADLHISGYIGAVRFLIDLNLLKPKVSFYILHMKLEFRIHTKKPGFCQTLILYLMQVCGDMIPWNRNNGRIDPQFQ